MLVDTTHGLNRIGELLNDAAVAVEDSSRAMEDEVNIYNLTESAHYII